MVVARRVLFGVLGLVALVAIGSGAPACKTASSASDDGPAGTCPLVVWYKPSTPSAYVEIVGDWNGWKRPGVLPEDAGGGYRAARLHLPPGEHAYAIVEDGVVLPDKSVGTTATYDNKEVTWVDLTRCQAPELRVKDLTTTKDGDAQLLVTLTPGAGGAPLDPGSVAVRGDGFKVEKVQIASILVSAHGLTRGKHTLFLSAKDVGGALAPEIRTAVWIDPTPFTPADMILYQVMVDRFGNEQGPVAPPPSAGGRAGGNVAGVLAALESGKLARLGVNTLWLSPLYLNPDGDFAGNDGRRYSGYHGYWPKDPHALDPRVATDASLSALVTAAHARGVRVLFDVVPNHVHNQHPYYAAHKDWFDGQSSCVCGQGTCDWATHEQTCWFAPYLPDVAWDNAEISRTMSTDVARMVLDHDGDGVRIDAVPMMPRSAIRRMAYDLRRLADGFGHQSFMLGEIFTGPGNFGDIRQHLGPFELDSSFHFPLMWSLRGAIAHDASPMSEIADTLDAADASWAGSGVTPTLIIGNHDVTRFSSESAGDASGDGWDPAPQSADPVVYAKQQLAIAAIYTLPGAPVIYYGDEVALAGRSDPDSRRVMPADASLSADQLKTRTYVERLGGLRACSPQLRRGARTTLLATAERYVFARTAPGLAPVIVDLARSPKAADAVKLPVGLSGKYVDALTGTTYDATSGTLSLLAAPARAARILLPVGDPCAP
jgi:glycosidase